MCAQSLQSYLTLCVPRDLLSLRFSRHTLSGLPFPLFRRSSRPRDHTYVSCIAGEFLTGEPARETLVIGPLSKFFRQLGGNGRALSESAGTLMSPAQNNPNAEVAHSGGHIFSFLHYQNFHFPPSLEELYIDREVIFQIAMIINIVALFCSYIFPRRSGGYFHSP